MDRLARFDLEYDALINSVKDDSNMQYYLQSQSRELDFLHENQARFRHITSKLPNKENLTILDIGTTPYSVLLNRTFPEADVHTIDIVDKYESRMQSEGVKFKKCDINQEELPFSDENFDAIVCTEVLEHLFGSPYNIFEKISNKLRSGGVFVFGTPNILRLKNRLKFVLGSSPQSLSTSADYFAHVREYSMEECNHLLTDSGFSIETSDYVIFHGLHEFIKYNAGRSDGWSKWALVPVAAIYYLICSAVPNFRTYLYFKAKKN